MSSFQTDQSLKAHSFLEEHIKVNANLLIQDLLPQAVREWDLSKYPWYEDLFLTFQEDVDPLVEEPELREPLEYWIVSDYFARMLKKHNALVTDHWGFNIWGRETSGQSIILDYIFQKIWQDHNTL